MIIKYGREYELPFILPLPLVMALSTTIPLYALYLLFVRFLSLYTALEVLFLKVIYYIVDVRMRPARAHGVPDGPQLHQVQCVGYVRGFSSWTWLCLILLCVPPEDIEEEILVTTAMAIAWVPITSVFRSSPSQLSAFDIHCYSKSALSRSQSVNAPVLVFCHSRSSVQSSFGYST